MRPPKALASSHISTFSSESNSDAEQRGTTFRQVMSSYTRSQQDSSSQESDSKAAGKSGTEQAGEASDEARAREAANAAASEQQQASAPPANSFTGSFGLRNNGQEDEAEGEAEAAGPQTTAPQNTPGATPQTGAATQFGGLSAMQLLLNGGSLAQILAAANNPQPVSGPIPAKGDGVAANAAAGGDAAKLVTSKSAALQLAAAAGVKAGKAKPEPAKRSSDTNGTASPDLSLIAANTLLPTAGANEARGGAGESTSASQQGVAIRGANAEALHLSATGQSENPANAAANNFAFAVRLTGEGAAAQHTESREAAQGPPALAGVAQPVVMAAAAAGAEMSGSGTQTGQHSGETPDQGALLFAGAAAPAGHAAQTSAGSASEDPTPVTVAEPETTGQNEAVRNVRLQLAGDNNQRVDIRLVDVGGEMRVSVRAGDTKLAQTLQEHIPDLSNRLNQQSVRAEIWSPRTENASQSGGANAGGQFTRGGDTPGQGGQQQRQGNGRQQQNQPDWVDEFENYSSRTTTTRSNQVWPQ